MSRKVVVTEGNTPFRDEVPKSCEPKNQNLTFRTFHLFPNRGSRPPFDPPPPFLALANLQKIDIKNWLCEAALDLVSEYRYAADILSYCGNLRLERLNIFLYAYKMSLNFPLSLCIALSNFKLW